MSEYVSEAVATIGLAPMIVYFMIFASGGMFFSQMRGVTSQRVRHARVVILFGSVAVASLHPPRNTVLPVLLVVGWSVGYCLSRYVLEPYSTARAKRLREEEAARRRQWCEQIQRIEDAARSPIE